MRIKFEYMEVVEVIGKAGGMVVLCKEDSKVMEVIATAFTLELKIRNTTNNSF